MILGSLRYSWQNAPHRIRTQLDADRKIKKWLIEHLAVEGVNADNKTWEAAAITAATE